MATSQPRGIRNNNPGNIDREPGTVWQGAADDQSSDPRFVVFKAPEYGIRAIARILLNYKNQSHITTLRGIASRWAPPSENNTSAYAGALAGGVGIGADEPVDVDQVAVMAPLVKAIIVHENGYNPYPDSVIAEGLRMAGVSDAPRQPLSKQASVVAPAAGGGLLTAGGVLNLVQHASGYADDVKKTADTLSGYASAPLIQHVITILLTFGGCLALLGTVSAILKQRRLS